MSGFVFMNKRLQMFIFSVVKGEQIWQGLIFTWDINSRLMNMSVQYLLPALHLACFLGAHFTCCHISFFLLSDVHHPKLVYKNAACLCLGRVICTSLCLLYLLI